MRCTTIPLFNFGSNQVDFGGIILPSSATFRRSFIEVGYSAKATLNSLLSTNLINSSIPSIPPTKSILLSVRGFRYPISVQVNCFAKSKHPKMQLHLRNRRYHTSVRVCTKCLTYTFLSCVSVQVCTCQQPSQD